jgi:hypothetical protein
VAAEEEEGGPPPRPAHVCAPPSPMELEELAPRLSAAAVDGRGRGGAAAADPGCRAGELKEEGLVQGSASAWGGRKAAGGGWREGARGGGER